MNICFSEGSVSNKNLELKCCKVFIHANRFVLILLDCIYEIDI